ncbi:MAG: hypothetical protein A2091_11190 [Desulfuromonadales bacterium GWD2_61_12]|nr:MAG: hypothetical protein A2005_07150 [Desulfuromonadales bacterium GWC2_61_20]OGR36651.1 MAG: hypothetical protein A2091_11190 [Desulfuromonadales bacterium GWD2_61_12]
MRHAFIIICLLLAIALTGGVWFNASALVPRWNAESELQIRPPSKIELPLGANTSLELQGEGLSTGTRAWLVPETTQRLALTGSFKTWGNPSQLRKVGNVVYLANYRNGVLALDLSDWRQPQRLGGMQLPGQAFDLEVQGTRLFVACGSSGLRVVDFKDPQMPRLLAALPLPGTAMAVQLRGDRLFIAGGKAGLLVIDISNPEHPFILAQAVTPGPALDVALSGECALLACGHKGIARFDITVSARPAPLAAITRPGLVRCLEGNGAIVYVGSTDRITVGGNNLLSSFDCSVPAQPRLLTEQSLSGEALTMQINRQELVIAQSSNGVSIFDIANPEQPQFRDKIEAIGSARGAIVEGDWLLIADGTGFLRTTRRSSQLELPVISRIANSVSAMPLLQDGRIYIPRQDTFLEIFAVDDPSHPEWLAKLPLPGNVAAMALRNDLLFLSIHLRDTNSVPTGGCLLVISLVDPTHPETLSSLSFPAAPVGLALDGDRLVLIAPNQPYGQKRLPPGGNGGRLYVIDLSEVRQPTVDYELELAQTPAAMDWRDGHAFIVMEEGKMQVVQAPAQRQPALAGAVDFPWLHQCQLTTRGAARGGGQRGGIKLIGGVAAVHSGVTELSFIDVAVPSRPVYLGAIEAPGYIGNMGVSDNFLYAAIANKGIATYDLGTPWRPRFAGLLPMPWATAFFSFSGEVLWYSSLVQHHLTCIPKPQLVETKSDTEGRSLALRLRTPPAAGDYSLWIESDKAWQEVPNSVRFSKH